MGKDKMSILVVKLHPEHGIGEGFPDYSFNFNSFFFGHTYSLTPKMVMGKLSFCQHARRVPAFTFIGITIPLKAACLKKKITAKGIVQKLLRLMHLRG
jgi:hypothetical protein